MNRSTTYFIAFFALALYISTIAFFTIKMVSYAREGRESIINQCTELSQNTFDLIEYFGGINEDFTQNIRAHFDKTQNIAAIILEKDSQLLFLYPPSSNLLAKDELNQTKLKSSSPLVSVFSTSIVFNSQPLTLTLALYHISPNLIHDLAKKCFFILFLTTIFVLFSIVINKILKKENNLENNLENNDLIKDDDFKLMESEFDMPNDSSFSFNEEILEPFEIKSDFDSPYEFDNLENHLAEENNFIQDTSHIQKVQQEEPLFQKKKLQYQGKTVSDPLGLFSPKTGFGWESYLETRLDSELIRASSSEQDLALILLKIQGLEHYPAYIEFVSKVLLDVFKFRDLVFEFGSEGFACIYQELNIEKSLELAEELYLALKEIFKNCDVKIGFGISTRSLRIIPGTRILKEAEQALEKALSDDEDPIIAFKANPDKYKDFIYDTL